jgi:hypothetical protein
MLPSVLIHNIIYYHVSYDVNYNILVFRFAVYPTCFDICNVIFSCVHFYVISMCYVLCLLLCLVCNKNMYL